jgi:hypothetical protein
MAVTAIVQHRVKDYAAWREIYDGFVALEQHVVGRPQGVYRGTGDPSDVLVIHQFETVAEAELFSSAAYLREVMQQAGVEGEPRIELYQEA